MTKPLDNLVRSGHLTKLEATALAGGIRSEPKSRKLSATQQGWLTLVAIVALVAYVGWRASNTEANPYEFYSGPALEQMQRKK